MNTTDLFLFAMLGVMVILLFTQSRKRRKQAEELFSSIAVGDRVVLHAGIIGTVAEVSDKELVIETMPKVKIKVMKQAVRAREAAPVEEN